MRTSDGYVLDTLYSDRFHRELSPTWLNYVAATNGVRPCATSEPFVYLELGCGFGTSAIVHAGAFPHGQFHACDFNAEQIARGHRHARALGVTNIGLYDATFDDLLREDIPPCDFIVLHGVYSWVGAAARDALHRIIASRLKPGGLLYVSYNCQPGWTIEIPLRRLMVELAQSATGDSAQRAEHAARMLKELGDSRLRYFTTNPTALGAIDSYRSASGSYLAHEFLNETWQPYYSVDVVDAMQALDLAFVGSASLADNHPMLVIDVAAAEAIAKLPTPRQRMLATDFATNRRFRRDVFVRGQTQARASEVLTLLNATILGCTMPPARIGKKTTVPRGELTFSEDFILALRQLLSKGSLTLADAVEQLGSDARDPVEIMRNLLFLIAADVLAPFERAHARPQHTHAPHARLERALAHVLECGTPRAIPSEVLGSGIEVHPTDARAMLEWLGGARDVATLAERLRTQLPDAHAATAAAKQAIDELVPTFGRLGLLV
jgi:SAM-dependent methyltransferase